MTVAQRIRMKMTRGSDLALLLSLVLVILPPAGCGQNSNPNNDSGNRGAGSLPQAQNTQIIADEVLVKFSPDTEPEIIERIQTELQLETIRKFHSPGLFLMKITGGTAVEAIIRKLKAYPVVEYAEPNYVVKANP